MNGLEFHESQVIRSGWRLEDGYKVGRQLAHWKHKLPDGLFCYNDPLATGVMRGLFESGIRVPHDVGVIGFDDDLVSAYLKPGLSTVAQPALEIGRTSAKRLLKRIGAKSEEWQVEKQYLKTRVIIRESCGCTKGASKSPTVN